MCIRDRLCLSAKISCPFVTDKGSCKLQTKAWQEEGSNQRLGGTLEVSWVVAEQQVSTQSPLQAVWWQAVSDNFDCLVAVLQSCFCMGASMQGCIL